MLRALRLGIVRSNVGPLAHAYAAAYRLAARLLAAALTARFPAAIESVLLRGSLTTELFVPALSDIDLFVVLRDQVAPAEHERVRDFYCRTARWLLLLDPYPWVLRWCDVEKLYRENPSLRFRALEGRESFECLHGANRLGDLPWPSPLEVELAHLSDLKSRLTYFNAFCLIRTCADELERRRREYMLFKLTLDMARLALFLSTGESIFDRGEILRRLTSAQGSESTFRPIGRDPVLSQLVLHTARYRLRRPFCGREFGLEALEERVLRAALQMLADFHARPSIRACADLAVEPEHFYASDRFLPSGHAVRFVAAETMADYRDLKARVLAGNDEGIDTVLQTDGLWINLSNSDPRLGNCTVVWRRGSA